MKRIKKLISEFLRSMDIYGNARIEVSKSLCSGYGKSKEEKSYEKVYAIVGTSKRGV